ncbi:MAG: hypothetical protein KBT04_00495 [Bacteroidales bacterium]|nr:hypothetical protein [Candidatus Colimorpha onthohippi]
MIIKAQFKEVVSVRPFNTQQGATKYSAQYVIESQYSRRDGSQGSNQFVVEVIYDQQPQLQLGACTDTNTYEFELYFRVNASKTNPTMKFQHITCTKVTQVIL